MKINVYKKISLEIITFIILLFDFLFLKYQKKKKKFTIFVVLRLMR